MSTSRASRWTVVIPWLFVLLWSSGFIGSKLGVPYAEPFTFLTLRYCIVLAILVPIALVTRAPWPKGRGQMLHVAFAGLLIHALYLSGCVSITTNGCAGASEVSAWNPREPPSPMGTSW